MQLTTLVALALAGMAAAKSPMHLKERVNAPDVWVRRGPAPDSHMLDLRFGLKQRAMADLEEKLLEISDPDSKTYGKWLNKEDVQSYMQPKAESTAAVKRWLAEHGIEEQLHKRSAAGDWMAAHMTVEQARDVLGADFAIWVHRETGEQLIRTTEYSVPRDVNECVGDVRLRRAADEPEEAIIIPDVAPSSPPLSLGTSTLSARQPTSARFGL